MQSRRPVLAGGGRGLHQANNHQQIYTAASGKQVREDAVQDHEASKVYKKNGSHFFKKEDNRDHRVFYDAEQLKNALYENLGEKEYDVADFYKDTGIAQFLARNEKFSNVVLCVISLNAIWIGVDTDHNPTKILSEAPLLFQVMEHFFCVFFAFEWIVRFLAFQEKVNCLRDHWFKFDTILVWMMIAETWLLPLALGESGGGMGDASILRLLRLLRLTRMARLMRSVPELVTLLKGMAVATRSVFSTLVLLILVLYVFAIVFKQQSEDNEILEYYFDTIPSAMWNLLLKGTLLDEITTMANDIQNESPLLSMIFLVFVLISSFTVLNMLIGVLCEVVSAVAQAEKEGHVVKFVKQTLIRVLMQVDNSGEGKISREQFVEFVNHEQSAPAFQELGVDKENLLSLVDVIYHDDEEREQAKEAHEAFQQELLLSMSNAASEENSPRTPKTPIRRFSKDSTGSEPMSVRSIASFKHGSSSSSLSAPEVKVKFAEIIQIILDLRSSNGAMVKDVVELRKFMTKNQNNVIECLQRMEMYQASMFVEVDRKQEELLAMMKSHEEAISTIKELAINENSRYKSGEIVAM